MAGKGIQIVVGAEYNGKDLAKAQRDIAKLQKQTQSTSDKLKEFGAGMSKVGKNLTAYVTLPLVGIGAAAVAASVQFESSMSKITGLVGIAAEEVEGMKSSVLDLAGETGRAPQELADALFVVTSAGLRGDEALSALESSAKAAAAGLGETKDIARALAGAVNAYGQDVLGAAEATDVIVATARAGNFETSQFAAAIGNILPVAVEAKAGFEQIGGAVALLTRTNGDAAKSATQVTALLRGFATPSATAQKAFEDMGMSAGAFRDIIDQQGLPAALNVLDDALGGNRERLLEVLGSSEAVSAATSILNADEETLAATFGDVAAAAGITDEAFGVVAETTGFKLQQAMSNFKAVLIEIGDVLAPFVQKLSDFASDALEKFRNLPDGAQQFIVALGGVAAAIGPVLMIGGKLVTMVGSIMAGFTGVGGFAGIAAAVTGPVGIIIAAIAGVIAIIVALWRESETFRNAVRDAFNTVKDAVMGAVDTIKGALESNSDAVNVLKNVFKALGDFIGTFIIPIWANYLSKVIEVVTWLIARWIDYMGILARVFQEGIKFVLTYVSGVIDAFGGMVDFILGGIEALLSGLAFLAGLLGLGDALNEARDNVAQFRKDVAENIGGAADAVRDAAKATESWNEAEENLDGYVDAALRAAQANGEIGVTTDGQIVAAENLASANQMLADVTNAAAAATMALNDAYANLTAFFSETRAIDRAHQLFQDFQEQMASNTAGFDGYSEAALANKNTFMDWADAQIQAAQGLDDPIERLEALKEVQREARQALLDQGLKPSESDFYQGVKEIVQNAKDEVDGLKDAVGTAEEAGLDVARAVADGISQGMSQQEAAINGAGLLAGDAVTEGVTTSLDIGSPSKVMAEQGRNAALGLSKGLSDMQLSIRSGSSLAGQSMIDGMIAGLDARAGYLYSRIRSIVASALSAAQAAAGSQASGSGTPTDNRSRGGLITGRGGPVADMIPAMLSDGEFVIRAQAVDTFGPGFFDALNRGMNPLAGMEAPGPSRPTESSGGLVINGGINVVSAPGEKAEESVPRALRKLAFVAGV